MPGWIPAAQSSLALFEPLHPTFWLLALDRNVILKINRITLCQVFADVRCAYLMSYLPPGISGDHLSGFSRSSRRASAGDCIDLLCDTDRRAARISRRRVSNPAYHDLSEGHLGNHPFRYSLLDWATPSRRITFPLRSFFEGKKLLPTEAYHELRSYHLNGLE